MSNQRVVTVSALCALVAVLMLVAFVPGILRAGKVYAQELVVTNCASDAQLRSFVDSAPPGDPSRVTFECGDATIRLQTPLSLDGSVEIDGGKRITLDGQNLTHHFRVNSEGWLTLAGLTLVNGFAQSDEPNSAYNPAGELLPVAGSIISEGLLVAKDVKFLDNHATGFSAAGAIYNSAILSMTNSTFAGNSGGMSGAIVNTKGAVIINSHFSENEGGGAGGLFDLGASTVMASIFEDNLSTDGAGAIFKSRLISETQNSLIVGSTLAGNSGELCGAIAAESGTLIISATTVSSNTSSIGGAVCFASDELAQLVIENSTISGNTGASGALQLVSFTDASSMGLTIANNRNTSGGPGGIEYDPDTFLVMITSIIAGNGSLNCSPVDPQVQTIMQSVIGDLSCAANPQEVDEFELRVGDPLLGPLADNGGQTLTHLPAANSPAVAIGEPTGCSPFDQRGIARWHENCDAGSIEVAQRPLLLRFPHVERGYVTPPVPTAVYTAP